MPDPFLHDHPEFTDLMRTVAAEQGIDPYLAEKDYWIMHCLFGLKKAGYDFQLKGGTSLSKGFGIIDRFSEDIDIHISPLKDMDVKTLKNQDKEQHRQSRKDFYDYLAQTITIPGVLRADRDTLKIEASGSEDLIGLDDVVAKRLDGSFELYQVKFTTDSERKDLALSFNWLLKKKGTGTSLLQKWAQDVKKYRSGGLAIAALQTNRKPDAEFSSCLENGKIIVSKIPDLVMQKLLEQFGNKSEIESFFNQFDFQHSLPEIDSFEDLLRDRLVGQHTTLEGWLRLKDKVKSWAQETDQPTSGGRIYLSHIHDLLTLSISQPLSQFFEVPDGYFPPTEEFHDNIIVRTKMAGATVIEGAPGMGKSTYPNSLKDFECEGFDGEGMQIEVNVTDNL